MNSSLLRYAVLGIPLAFAGLPLYVHLPEFYSTTQGMSLTIIGVILLFTRLSDAFIDPAIGYISDRYAHLRRLLMGASIVVLAISYGLLFSPIPFLLDWQKALWLTLLLIITYGSFSMLLINYYAAGVSMAAHSEDHTRISSYRETSILIGILIAASLPSFLMAHMGTALAYQLYGLIFITLILLCGIISVPGIPIQHTDEEKLSFHALLADKEIRWVLALFFINMIPVAMTSTLFLFFVDDILQLKSWSGGFLVIYFCAAAMSIPVWNRLSYRFSKRVVLMSAMSIAIVSFIAAYALGRGDKMPFTIICIITGFSLGADLILLPALFSEVLAGKKHSSAIGFGTWNFISKLTLALAAGLLLPLLSWLGYTPHGGSSLGSLSFCYALVPCFFKAMAFFLLIISPININQRSIS